VRRLAAIIAALVTFAFVLALLEATPPRPGLARLVGAEARHLIDVRGGVHLVFDGASPATRAALEARAELSNGNLEVRQDGRALIVDVVGVPIRELAAVRKLFSAPHRLELRLVDSSSLPRTFGDAVQHDAMAHDLEVSARYDDWHSGSGAWVLEAASVDQLTHYLHALSGRTEIPSLTAGGLWAIEAPPAPQPGDDPRHRPLATAYPLRGEAVITARQVATAEARLDADEQRPAVHVRLSDQGGERLARATSAGVGQKMAILVDERVMSVPIINSPVIGGRLSITMGRGQSLDQATELAAAIAAPPIPDGLKPVSSEWRAPTVSVGRMLAGNTIAAMIAGLLAALLITAMCRLVPLAAVPMAILVEGKNDLARRGVITVIACAVTVLASRLPVPGAHGDALHRPAGLLELGVLPMFAAFAIVELVAVLVPALRRRRDEPVWRARLHRLALGFGVLITTLHAWFEVHDLQHAWPPMLEAGTIRLIVAALTLIGGTLLCAVLAGLIERRGIGPGWPLVWASIALPSLVDQLRLAPPGSHVELQLASLVSLAALGGALAGLRLHRDGRTLRLPLAGLIPLAPASTLALLSTRLPGAYLALRPAEDWMVRHPPVIAIGIVCISLCVAVLTARPLAQPFPSALTVSILALLVLFAVQLATTGADVTMVLLGPLLGAVVVDVVASARAHRGQLVCVAAVSEVQRAEALRDQLASAGVAAHLHAASFRALSLIFGAFTPVKILVSARDAERARSEVGVGP
jgi:hypothetical protein